MTPMEMSARELTPIERVAILIGERVELIDDGRAN